MKALTNAETEGLTSQQRSAIRKSDKSVLALSREWGVSVATIRKIVNWTPDKPAKKAARKKAATKKVTKSAGAAKPVAPLNRDKLAQLQVLGGPVLPQTLK